MTSTWICKTRCQDRGQVLINKGDIVTHTGPIELCEVCEGEKKVDGKFCRKCDGTGRAWPSHHFRPYDAETERLAELQKKEEDTERLKELRAELDEVGMAYDMRWGVVKLEQQVVLARKTKGSEVKETFKPITDKDEAIAKAKLLGLTFDKRSSLEKINKAIKEKMEYGEHSG